MIKIVCPECGFVTLHIEEADASMLEQDLSAFNAAMRDMHEAEHDERVQRARDWNYVPLNAMEKYGLMQASRKMLDDPDPEVQADGIALQAKVYVNAFIVDKGLSPSWSGGPASIPWDLCEWPAFPKAGRDAFRSRLREELKAGRLKLAG